MQTCVLNNTDSLSEGNSLYSSFSYSDLVRDEVSVYHQDMCYLSYMLISFVNKSRVNFKLTDLLQQEYLGFNIFCTMIPKLLFMKSDGGFSIYENDIMIRF